MAAFHETEFGRRFFGAQLPKLIKELGRIADALEEQNKKRETVVQEVENTDNSEV